jgi:hypothetical protein
MVSGAVDSIPRALESYGDKVECLFASMAMLAKLTTEVWLKMISRIVQYLAGNNTVVFQFT